MATEIDKLIFTLDADTAPLDAKFAAIEAKASAVGQRIAQSTGLSRPFTDAVASANAFDSELDRLRQRYDATYAASLKYAQAQKEVGLLLSSGVFNSKQAADALKNLEVGINHASISAREAREPFILFRELVEGSFIRATASGAAFASRMGLLGVVLSPVGLAITALAAATIGLVVAQNKFESSQTALTNAIRLGGDAVGLSRGDLEAYARATSFAGDESIKVGRSIIGAYAESGRISGDALKGLVSVTEDY